MSGGKLRPLHLLLIVAGVVAVGWLGYYLFFTGEKKVSWANKVFGVDVVTGQVYAFDPKKAAFPAPSPTTGEFTIFPANYNQDTEKWFVDPRSREAIKNLGDKAKAVVDPSTGELKTTGDIESGS